MPKNISRRTIDSVVFRVEFESCPTDEQILAILKKGDPFFEECEKKFLVDSNGVPMPMHKNANIHVTQKPYGKYCAVYRVVQKYSIN